MIKGNFEPYLDLLIRSGYNDKDDIKTSILGFGFPYKDINIINSSDYNKKYPNMKSWDILQTKISKSTSNSGSFITQRDITGRDGKKYKTFLAFDKFYDYIYYMGMTDCRNFYETIHSGNKTKLYFDIDIGKDLPAHMLTEDYCDKVRDDIVAFILETFPDVDIHNEILILTAHKKGEKMSMHIILDKYMFSWKQFDYFYSMMSESLNPEYFEKNIIDFSLVRKNEKALKQFRGIYNNKIGSDRTLIFRNKWVYKNNQIEYVMPIDYIDKKNIKQAVKDIYMHLCGSTLVSITNKHLEEAPLKVIEKVKKHNHKILYNDIEDDQINQILSMFEDRKNFKVGNINNNILTLNRINPSYCNLCNRKHDSAGQWISINGNDVVHHCYRGNNFNIIGSLEHSNIAEVISDGNTLDDIPKNIPEGYYMNDEILESIEFAKTNSEPGKINIDLFIENYVEANYKEYEYTPYSCGLICKPPQDMLCKLCRNVHTEPIKVYHFKGSVYEKCTKYDKFKRTIKRFEKSEVDNNHVYQKINQLDAKFSEYYDVHEYNSKYNSPLKLNSKIQIVNSRTGTGKTTSIVNAINNAIKPFENIYENILYITPRISLCKNIVNVFKSKGITIKSYQDSKGKIKDSTVVQLESICRLDRLDYDVVICDEITSLITQMDSGLHINIKRSQCVINNLLQLSKHIVFMDAFIDNRLIKLVNHFFPFQQIPVSINKFCKQQRKAFKYTFDKTFNDNFFDKIGDGKKIVYISGSVKHAKKIKASLDKLKISSQLYCQDTINNKGIADEIANPNKHWKKYQCVIYTSTIGSGVDFSAKHFDYKFMYATNRSNVVREYFQMIGRDRETSTEELHYYLNNVHHDLPVTREGIINGIKTSLNTVDGMFDKAIKNIPDYMIDISAKYSHELKRFVQKASVLKDNFENNIWLNIMIDNMLEANLSKVFFEETFNKFFASENYVMHNVDVYNKDIDERILTSDEHNKIERDKDIKIYSKVDLGKYEECKKIVNEGLAQPKDRAVVTTYNMFTSVKTEYHKLLTPAFIVDHSEYLKTSKNLKLYLSHSLQELAIVDINNPVRFTPLFCKATLTSDILKILQNLYDKSLEKPMTFYTCNLTSISDMLLCDNSSDKWGLFNDNVYKTGSDLYQYKNQTKGLPLGTNSSVLGFLEKCLKPFGFKLDIIKKCVKYQNVFTKKITSTSIRQLAYVEEVSTLCPMLEDPKFEYGDHNIFDDMKQWVDMDEKLETIERINMAEVIS